MRESAAADEAAQPANDLPRPPREETTLTKALTSQQRSSISHLRKKLSTPSQLWGVELTDEDDVRSDVLISHFVVANSSNVDKAFEQLSNTLKWREGFKPSAEDPLLHDEHFSRAGFVHGKAKDGSPIIWTNYGSAGSSIFENGGTFLRWRIALQELAIRQLDWRDTHQVFVVGDYGGASPSAESRALAKQASQLFTQHYPEILDRHIFLNMPAYVTWIMAIFKPIIPVRTLQKFDFVGAGAEAHRAALLKYVDESEWSASFGQPIKT